MELQELRKRAQDPSWGKNLPKCNIICKSYRGKTKNILNNIIKFKDTFGDKVIKFTATHTLNKKDISKFVGLLQTDRGAAEKFMATHDKSSTKKKGN